IHNLIAKAWLQIVPLRVGGGTRLKIIESMALGTPVVSTSKGAEGLDVTHGKNILIADDPKAFAHAVRSVLKNADLRQSLSVEGRKLIAEKYSSDVIAQKLTSLLGKILERSINDQ
ncbi:MAG: glycosyltransferase family 4 protein, partial [Anaerolineales bacterium]